MGATMLAAAVAIAVFSMGLKAASQEAVDLGNAELTAGVIELAAGAPGCDTGDGCFDDCTRWYEVSQQGNSSTPETSTLELTPKNLSASNCSCATGSGLVTVGSSNTTAYITFSDDTTGVVEVDADFLDALRFRFAPSGCNTEFKVTSGSVLGVKAPQNVVTRESYLEVLVVLMIGTSAVLIVAVFLFGRFSRDQTVYIELDG